MPLKIFIVNMIADLLMYTIAALSFKVKEKISQKVLLAALILVFCINLCILIGEI